MHRFHNGLVDRLRRRVAKAMAEKIRSFLTGYNATPAQIEAAVGNH